MVCITMISHGISLFGLQECTGHLGSKASKIVFCKDKLFTTGFSRMSERQYSVWDAVSKNGTQEDFLVILKRVLKITRKSRIHVF